MESPPSVSTHSDVPPLSEDSGLLVTSGSFSSDSASGWHYVNSELQESDSDELSLCGSTETDRMCGDNFNTVKKGPCKLTLATIEPPPEFQDFPTTEIKKKSKKRSKTRSKSVQVHLPFPKPIPIKLDVPLTLRPVSPVFGKSLNRDPLYERRQCHRFASPGLLHLSPCRGSLSSRLSSSHNSLITQLQTDDSNFITQAISHDTLLAKPTDIMDMYNVPFDSDIYAVPIDMVKTQQNCVRRSKKQRFPKKRKTVSHTLVVHNSFDKQRKPKDSPVRQKSKRHSLPSSSRKSTVESDTDSLHMTLKEMRKYLQALYTSSSESDTKNNTINISEKNKCDAKTPVYNDTVTEAKVFLKEINEGDIKTSFRNIETNNNKCSKTGNAKNRKQKEKEKCVEKCDAKSKGNEQKSRIFRVGILSLNLKQSLCKWFRWRRDGDRGAGVGEDKAGAAPAAVRRALPPLPQAPLPATRSPDEENVTDFATSIQKVKDYGWYWGPISVEAAEKLLSNEPDGSFIVRDSSDCHYIFTLTFKLNGLRHVRIEHDQGNFCFGGCSMFKAQTIVEFIENAVETSRSGRYLFFLNLRPMQGPVRVQLLYPVSRFKRVQSLQHMSRFVILKNIRRDKISELPLPRRMMDYLSAKHFYSEQLAEL